MKTTTKSVKPAIKGLNVRLLRKVQKYILEEPRRLNMGFWTTRWSEGSQKPPCGTAACIAGWTVILSGKHVARDGYGAAPILGLPDYSIFKENAASALFMPNEWPSKFALPYKSAKSDNQRAEIAVRRIDHFILTGE